ncbi:MAG: hypothetical protein H6R17_2509 [Proteobacteria bacterium]|nr:hypothetical protein [Pseudomonadota bacterium]
MQVRGYAKDIFAKGINLLTDEPAFVMVDELSQSRPV